MLFWYLNQQVYLGGRFGCQQQEKTNEVAVL